MKFEGVFAGHGTSGTFLGLDKIGAALITDKEGTHKKRQKSFQRGTDKNIECADEKYLKKII